MTVATPLMWWLFVAFVAVALTVDFLAMRQQGAHTVSMREAAIWSLVWVGVSFVFVGWFWWYIGGTADAAQQQHAAHDQALAFVTGYLVEKALAI